MDYFQSIILGVVEGVTEFLPISSTAHLVISTKLLDIAQTDFIKSFEIIIQLGAILAVVWLYWKRFILNKESLKRIAIAFLPTAVVGLSLYQIFKTHLIENLNLIAWALLIGGFLMIVFDQKSSEKAGSIKQIEHISYQQCIIIGLIQSLAIIPGVSRAAATIIGGLSLGMRRKLIVEFSFLLAVPTILAATSYDLIKSSFLLTSNQLGILVVGFLTSFIFAVVAIRFLLSYVQKHNFFWFGIYRLVIGLLLLIAA